MIIRDEEAVILRCLKNIAPLVDAFVIADTGSEDNTIALVEDFIAKSGKPGVVVKNKWRNFGFNRTLALRHAEAYLYKQCGILPSTPLSEEEFNVLTKQPPWYICFTDADNRLLYPKDFDKHLLSADEYRIEMRRGPWSYTYFFAIRFDPFGIKQWKWREPLHEYLTRIGAWRPTKGNITGDKSKFVMLSGREGARSRDILCYERDALTFKEKILKAKARGRPEPARKWFYYAQSLKDSQRHRDAVEAYLKVTTLNGWVQERYISYMECGRIYRDHLSDKSKAQEYFLSAMDLLPLRFEASYELAEMARLANHFLMGYILSKQYVGKSYPEDSLFIDLAASTWKMYDVASVCAYYIGRRDECKILAMKALEYPIEDEKIKARILQNISYC